MTRSCREHGDSHDQELWRTRRLEVEIVHGCLFWRTWRLNGRDRYEQELGEHDVRQSGGDRYEQEFGEQDVREWWRSS